MNQIIEANKSNEVRVEAQTTNHSAIMVTNAQLYPCMVTCPKQKVSFFFRLPISYCTFQ